jgi:hypothetical protein
MMQELLLSLWLGEKRFLARRDHVAALQRLDTAAPLPSRDARGRPLVFADLGSLLGASSAKLACHGVRIELRRRSVLLGADRVDEADPAVAPQLQPLPAIVQQAARRPWISAVLPVDTAPILLLDLWQIAMDVAAGDTSSAPLKDAETANCSSRQ